MKIDDLLVWRDFPARTQKSFFQLVALGALALAVLVWLILRSSTADALAKAETLLQTRTKVSGLAREAQTLEARVAALANLAPMAAAQQVAREMSLEKRISSIRPAQLGGTQEGVQIYFEGLNLPDLTGLLSNLKTRGGLKLVSCTLTHRLDVTNLADLQLVLVR